MLVKLGRLHRGFGGGAVTPAHVLLAGSCLQKAFRSKLGAAWSAHMSNALAWALELIGQAMIEGLNDPAATSTSGPASEADRGGYEEARQQLLGAHGFGAGQVGSSYEALG